MAADPYHVPAAARPLPIVATLTTRLDGGLYADDVTAAGGTDAVRVWSAAAHILRDAFEGGWLGSPYGTGRAVALRYVGPVEGEDAEWIDLTADLEALVLVSALFGYLSGQDGDWPWADSLIGPTHVREAA